ncbi:MAG TPA: XdhC family protein [Stellaceae bacterium]|nr:XdhC family protein [Stellaceae bacterium]
MDDIREVATAGSIASHDVLDAMVALRERREPFAVATVIETQGSVSAKTGAKAVIGHDGRVAAGWVGGGCAEGAVCHTALDCLETCETAIVDLDLNDEVLGTGMPCGGTMRVFVEPFSPKPRLWILGHGKVAETLCTIGATIGFEVVIDDPMADRTHYPQAAQLIAEDFDYRRLDPQAKDCVVVATQHKGDHESMARCLRSPVSYIALIASRKRSKLVIDYLREQGFGETELARVYAPAGLDLGARTPEEIALSVLSEAVMLRHKASGAPRRGQILQSDTQS